MAGTTIYEIDKKCLNLPPLTLVNVLKAAKSTRKINKLGFTWSDSQNSLCDKIVCLTDMTYYVGEVDEFEVIEGKALKHHLKKSSIKNLLADLNYLINL